ncbi:bifunctional RNase H/acid phosphatase [Streptomyces sodiiphilus]|uniref:Bifunctional RNase H/acid phosphatase n=1 Tax=Streptomyces sodiiphilus TaxID=226217 RepID=A0ABN2NT41_9ACTN
MTRKFVVEADGGSRGNPGPAGYGAVVRDAVTGEVLAERAEYLGTATNNVAEYRGLIAGLRAARELDPEATVLARLDSKLVVEQMTGRWKIKHPAMRPLASQAREILPEGAVRYEWIPREKNKHADRLANEAMDAGRRGERWEPSAPPAGPVPADTPSAGESPPGTSPAGREQPPPAPTGWGPADQGPPTTLVLLRHGETALTPQKRFSGSGGEDLPLSPAGLQQAEAAARVLAARGTVDAVVSSPLARCRQTAQVIAARLGAEPRIDEGWRETDFGAWDGLTFGEVRERHPEDLDAWLRSPEARPTGGGESFAEVARRVALARDKTIARYAGRTVLVVTHVTPVKTLLRLALDAPPEALFRMELSAASLSAIAYYRDGGVTVRLFNDTAHLR